MRICFVGSASSAHIVKWCSWFCGRGHEVHVISFVPGEIDNTFVHLIDLGISIRDNDFKKMRYLLAGRRIKALVDEIQPDIVNVHYASGYGIAVALSGTKHYVLSVWGSDVYEFPQKSVFHKMLLKYSLKKAETLFSTSKSMAREAAKYTNKTFTITPFGVDMGLFSPEKRTTDNASVCYTVGIIEFSPEGERVKSILRRMAEGSEANPNLDIVLRVAGKDKSVNALESWAEELGISKRILFNRCQTTPEAMEEKDHIDGIVLTRPVRKELGIKETAPLFLGIPIIDLDFDIIPKMTLAQLKEMSCSAKESERVYTETDVEARGLDERDDVVVLSIVIQNKRDFIIGTVKSLSENYGIQYILRSAAEIKNETEIPLAVRISGDGPQAREYHELAKELGIDDITEWLGYISQERAAKEWANMDVAVIPSESESFGVSAVEAQACGTPLIISDVPGLMEATDGGKSGIIVRRNETSGIIQAIKRYYYYPNDRLNMGMTGIKVVKEKYEINKCFQAIETVFFQLLDSHDEVLK